MIKLLWLSANHVRSYSIFEARTSNQFIIFQIRENLLYFAANTKLPTNTERKLIDCANFAACAIFIQQSTVFPFLLFLAVFQYARLCQFYCIHPGLNCMYSTWVQLCLPVFHCSFCIQLWSPVFHLAMFAHL